MIIVQRGDFLGDIAPGLPQHATYSALNLTAIDNPPLL